MTESTTPAAEDRASAAPSREEIAREIEPAAWQLWGFNLPERSWRREASLRTADTILALLRSRQPAPESDRIAELEAEVARLTTALANNAFDEASTRESPGIYNHVLGLTVHKFKAAEARAAAAEARVRALEEALGPFARRLEGDRYLHDGQVIECQTRNEVLQLELRVADFRRATNLIAQPEQEGGA